MKRGVLVGLIAAVVGWALGYFLVGQTPKAALYSLNWASLVMFMLSGVFVAGQIRQHPLDLMVIVSGSNKVPIEPVPWERISICVIAGLWCAGLVLVAPLVMERS